MNDDIEPNLSNDSSLEDVPVVGSRSFESSNDASAAGDNEAFYFGDGIEEMEMSAAGRKNANKKGEYIGVINPAINVFGTASKLSSSSSSNIASSGLAPSNKRRTLEEGVQTVQEIATDTVSSISWNNVLSVVSLALFIDVIILTIYLYREEGSNRMPSSGNEGASLRISNLEANMINWKSLPPQETTIDKIAFGSCSSQLQPQTYWDTISMFNPNILLLTGNNILCDDGEGVLHSSSEEDERSEGNNNNCTASLQKAYEDWSKHPSFIGAKGTIPIIAMLDKYDYGGHCLSSLKTKKKNDVDETNPYKDIAKEMFLNFFSIPDEDERRSRDGRDGLYTSYEWGPIDQRIQIIILDTRYEKSSFMSTDMIGQKGKELYKKDYVNKNKHILSEDQWEWFEALLVATKPKPQIRIIVSSIQVLDDTTGYDNWSLFPHEHERLLTVLKDSSTHTYTVILSSCPDRRTKEDNGVSGAFYKSKDITNLIEITSSSLTTTPRRKSTTNSVHTSTINNDDDENVHDNNFGSIEIDWANKEISFSLRRVEPTTNNGKKNADAGSIIHSYEYTIP